MEKIFLIAEPWDFTSTDGDNVLKVRVIRKQGDGILAEAISGYSGKDGLLYIVDRDGQGNVNIYQKSPDGELTFVMIGSYFA